MLSGLETPLHLAVLLLIVLAVFGAKRVPELGRSLGTGMRDFKTGITGSNAGLAVDTTALSVPSAASRPTHSPDQHAL